MGNLHDGQANLDASKSYSRANVESGAETAVCLAEDREKSTLHL